MEGLCEASLYLNTIMRNYMLLDLILIFIYVFVYTNVHVHASTYDACSKREHWTFWRWSHRQLWANQPGHGSWTQSSPRAVHTHNHWAVSNPTAYVLVLHALLSVTCLPLVKKHRCISGWRKSKWPLFKTIIGIYLSPHISPSSSFNFSCPISPCVLWHTMWPSGLRVFYK